MLREIDSNFEWKETTTDKLIFENKNNFKDWHCSAGAKGLYIDADGNIWRGVCFSADTDRFNYHKWGEFLKEKMEGNLAFASFAEEEYTTWYKKTQKSFGKWSDEFRKQDIAYAKTIFSNDKEQYMGVIGNIYEGFFYDRPEIVNFVECPFDKCGCGSDIWYPKFNPKHKGIKSCMQNLAKTDTQKDQAFRRSTKSQKDYIEPIVGLEPAYNIEYQVLWDLSRLCNYACDYCWPATHNTTAPQLSFSIVKRIVNAIIYWIVNPRQVEIRDAKKVRFFFSGGEPTLHDDFLKICKYIRDEGHIVSVTTNGTASTSYFNELAHLCHNILFSIHFKSIDKYKIKNQEGMLDNIREVIKINSLMEKDKWVELKLMAPPGYVRSAIAFYHKAISETDILSIHDLTKKPYGTVSVVPIRTMGQSNETAVYDKSEQKLLNQFFTEIV